VEQRHALGQADGHSLVAIDHRQTVQQGMLVALSITVRSAVRHDAASDANDFLNQFLLNSYHFAHRLVKICSYARLSCQTAFMESSRIPLIPQRQSIVKALIQYNGLLFSAAVRIAFYKCSLYTTYSVNYDVLYDYKSDLHGIGNRSIIM